MPDEFSIVVANIVSVVAFCFCLIYGITMFVDKPNCALRWEPRETEWSWRGGCRVKIDGTWTPASAVWIKADKN